MFQKRTDLGISLTNDSWLIMKKIYSTIISVYSFFFNAAAISSEVTLAAVAYRLKAMLEKA